MRPLDYKTIGEENHLTFDSIRRYVLKELSQLGEEEAKSHIEGCPRCRSIEQSLAFPSSYRRNNIQDRYMPKVWWGVLLFVLALGILTTYFVLRNSPSEPVSLQEVNIPIANSEAEVPVESEAAPVLEAIDTLSQITDEPTVADPISTNKKFDNYIEKPQNQPQPQVRGIYGKITQDGQPVPGVTVMTPGSSKARITDATGKYYIQVPSYAKSLIFIYQGKQLVKGISSSSRRLDLQLNGEDMTYPTRPATAPGASNDSLQ